MSLIIDSKYVRLISSRLRNFKQKKDYLWNFSCPICGDSKKNLSKARGYVYAKGNSLFYSCHNCGAGTNVANLIKAVDESILKEYVLERYKEGTKSTRSVSSATFDIQPPRFDKLEKQKIFEHGEWCDKLTSGHFCLTYLQKRKIPQEYYNKLLFTSHYKQFIDALIPNHGKQLIDDARLIIPFYDEYNNLIAVSGRALETGDKSLRYVTVRTNDSQQKLVYGVERVNKQEDILLVEGPIDSLFLNNCLASGDANLSLTAKDLQMEKIILVFDNEPRNKEIVKMMQNAIKSEHNIVIWPSDIQGKDINEMVLSGISPDEIRDIISRNTFKGLRAQMNFNMWKKV